MANDNHSNGAFLLSRSLFESDIWFMPPDYLKVWIYLIGKANHRGNKFRGYYCERGQYFCDYGELLEQLRYRIGYRTSAVNEGRMKDIMKYLRDTGRITTTKQPRGILVCVLNYDKYQNMANYGATAGATDEATAKQPGGNQSVRSINKNDNNEKNDKKVESGGAAAPTPAQLVRDFLNDESAREAVIRKIVAGGWEEAQLRSEVKKFCAYWTERNKSGLKQRWELEKTFELRPRLNKWLNNALQFSQRSHVR